MLTLYPLVVAVFGAWCVLSVVKAVRALRGGTPYTFAAWDGGLLRVGKTLSRTGTALKVVVLSLLAITCAVALTGLVPLPAISIPLVGLSLTSVVVDLATTRG